jgi:plasmid stabilization system protein ParE
VLRRSLRARADLKAIHAHIARDSPRNASAIAHEFLALAARIPATPHTGRVVPELDDPTIREIPVHSWRLIYQLRDRHVFVLTLVHKRRLPAPDQLRS